MGPRTRTSNVSSWGTFFQLRCADGHRGRRVNDRPAVDDAYLLDGGTSGNRIAKRSVPTDSVAVLLPEAPYSGTRNVRELALDARRSEHDHSNPGPLAAPERRHRGAPGRGTLEGDQHADRLREERGREGGGEDDDRGRAHQDRPVRVVARDDRGRARRARGVQRRARRPDGEAPSGGRPRGLLVASARPQGNRRRPAAGQPQRADDPGPADSLVAGQERRPAGPPGPSARDRRRTPPGRVRHAADAVLPVVDQERRARVVVERDARPRGRRALVPGRRRALRGHLREPRGERPARPEHQPAHPAPRHAARCRRRRRRARRGRARRAAPPAGPVGPGLRQDHRSDAHRGPSRAPAPAGRHRRPHVRRGDVRAVRLGVHASRREAGPDPQHRRLRRRGPERVPGAHRVRARRRPQGRVREARPALRGLVPARVRRRRHAVDLPRRLRRRAAVHPRDGPGYRSPASRGTPRRGRTTCS